jgi:hypothetical protein
MKLTGQNRGTWGKTCPSSTLSTTNATWTDPGSIPGLRGERPATNRLSHCTDKTDCKTLMTEFDICLSTSHTTKTARPKQCKP